MLTRDKVIPRGLYAFVVFWCHSERSVVVKGMLLPAKFHYMVKAFISPILEEVTTLNRCFLAYLVKATVSSSVLYSRHP